LNGEFNFTPARAADEGNRGFRIAPGQFRIVEFIMRQRSKSPPYGKTSFRNAKKSAKPLI